MGVYVFEKAQPHKTCGDNVVPSAFRLAEMAPKRSRAGNFHLSCNLSKAR